MEISYCPHCGYHIQDKGAKPAEKKEVEVEEVVTEEVDRTNALNAALIIILAILTLVAANYYPVMAIPTGAVALIMLLLSAS